MTTEQIVQMLVGFVIGIFGMPITQYAKTKLGWNGKRATLLSVGVSAIIGLAAIAIARLLGWVTLDWQDYGAVALAIFSAGQVAYKLMLADRPAVEPLPPISRP